MLDEIFVLFRPQKNQNDNLADKSTQREFIGGWWSRIIWVWLSGGVAV